MKTSHRHPHCCNLHSSSGFSLIELLITVTMTGILAAIVAPTWQTFVETQRLNTSLERVYYGMQEAKTNAKRDKSDWQVSFREISIDQQQRYQWAVHPAFPSRANIDLNQLPWRNLPEDIRIVDPLYGDRNETTLDEYTTASNQTALRIQFNDKGHTNGQMGRLTLAHRNSNPQNPRRRLRCVIVSTLIGTLRTSHNQRTQRDDRYCY